MSLFLGDLKENQTVHFMWSSNDSNGASIDRSVNGEVRVYKNNEVTQTTVGVTDTEAFDGLSGVHACTIDTSGAFYVRQNNYSVILDASTIDGQIVNAVLANFSIENRSVVEIIGVAGSGLTALGGMSDPMKAEVRTEASGVLFLDQVAELDVVPDENSPMGDKINFVFEASKNKFTQTKDIAGSGTQRLHKNDNSTVFGTAPITDDGTIFTRGKIT